MTSLADQSVEELGGTWSVLVRQRRDHAELGAMLRELEAAPVARQPALLQRIYRLVFPHAFAEETLLWPAVRRVLPEGERLTLMVEEEHQQVNELAAELDRTPLSDPTRGLIIGRIVELLREDVRDEEDALLPRLQERLTDRELRRLGLLWEVLRHTAPTRAHPLVARRPPGNALAALPLSLLDRSRDHLDTAARSFERLRPGLESASRLLGRWAAAVECIRVLRRGERPETRTR